METKIEAKIIKQYKGKPVMNITFIESYELPAITNDSFNENAWNNPQLEKDLYLIFFTLNTQYESFSSYGGEHKTIYKFEQFEKIKPMLESFSSTYKQSHGKDASK